MDTALGALHYASNCQHSAEGSAQEFHDWGWVFVEITETLYAINKVIDRQLTAPEHGRSTSTDQGGVQQIRSHLALLGIALADARGHAHRYYELVSRMGSAPPHP